MTFDRSQRAEIERAQAAFEADPSSKAFAPLAEAYRVAGRIDEALDVLQKGIPLHPGIPAALTTLGRCFLARGRAADAKGPLERAVSLSPGSLAALSALAEAYERSGEADAAAKTYRTLLLLDPGDAHSQGRLAALQALGLAPQQVERGRADSFEVRTAGDALGGTLRPAAIPPRAVPRPLDPPSAGPRVVPAIAVDPSRWTPTARPAPPPARVTSPAVPIQTATVGDLFVQQGHPEKAIPIYENLLRLDPSNADLARKLAAAQSATAAPAPDPPPSPAPNPARGADAELRTLLSRVRGRRRGPTPAPALARRRSEPT